MTFLSMKYKLCPFSERVGDTGADHVRGKRRHRHYLHNTSDYYLDNVRFPDLPDLWLTTESEDTNFRVTWITA